MQRIRTWQVNHSRYGATPFCCQIGMGKFYGIALKALGLILVCWVAAVASILLVASLLNVVPTGPQNGFWLGVLTMAILLFATIPVGAYVHARLQNLV